ncbi:hypothetical protein SLS60_000047 [Paraconiothyrium brasiliense]|uniref:Nephrocystin 3-like N-terminal domain-containing protein n=1 Tax=Paraconiothyrium brasiliense TaxID=300254 RepID=A0ABR3S5C4_9PLEO
MDPLFWVSGKPGSGKSTMMKYLVETLPSHVPRKRSDPLPIVASYFIGFDRSDVAKSIVGILRSLLRQILKASPSMIAALSPIYLEKKQTEAKFVWTQIDLEECFSLVFSHVTSSPIILLIDAIDEYDGEDDTISEYFLKMARQHHSAVRICVSGRKRAAFVHEFATCPVLQMEVETKEDIESYVNARLSAMEDRSPNKCLSSIATLSSDIVDKADGVFLWVKLVCDQLVKAARRGEDYACIKRRLLSMPEDLNALYQRILNDVPVFDRKEALAMLAIINTAFELLSPLELRVALHYSLGIYDDIYNAQLAEDRIAAVTGGFLEVRTSGDDDLTVNLAHSTVRTFLNSKFVASTLSSPDDCHNLTSDKTILRACANRLASLSTLRITTTSLLEILISDGVFEDKYIFLDANGQSKTIDDVAKEPFVKYSALFLVRHAGYVEHRSEASSFLLASSIPFRHWAQLLQSDELTQHPTFQDSRTLLALRRDASPKTMIEFMVLANLERHFFELLTPTLDSNQNGGRLLYAVAYSGNIRIAEALLGRGAIVSANTRCATSALVRAIYHDNLQVARLFLEHGASPDVSGIAIGAEELSPLEAAVTTNSANAIRLLAEHRANLDCYISVFGTALQAAARRGDLSLLHALIEGGANVNGTVAGSINSSPLEAATLTTNRDYQKEILELLITAGASLVINPTGYWYDSLIARAVHLGNVVAVESFLQHGATIPEKLLCEALRLQADTETPHTDKIVRLLISYGATLDRGSATTLGLAILPDLTVWADEKAEEYRSCILNQIRNRPGYESRLLDMLETTSTRENMGDTTGERSRALSPWIPSNLPERPHSVSPAGDTESMYVLDGLLSPMPTRPKPEYARDPVRRVSSPGGVPPSRPRSLQT